MPTGIPSQSPSGHTLYMREWRAKNRAHVLAYERQWRKDNNEAACARQTRTRKKLKADIIAAYGGKCSCCGIGDWEFLSIDHIGGGGLQELKNKFGARGASQELYRWLKKNGYPKDRYRLLCMNCNGSYGFYGYCPHSGCGGELSNNQRWDRNRKRKVTEAYGGKCECCQETAFEFLTVDHKDRVRMEGEPSQGLGRTYRWLVKNKFPKGPYRLLCINCNFADGIHGGCPHQKLRLECA